MLIAPEGTYVVFVGQGPDGNCHSLSPLNNFLILFCIRVLQHYLLIPASWTVAGAFLTSLCCDIYHEYCFMANIDLGAS